MFYSSVNTDFAAYETKIAFGLTKRQIICFLAAALIGLPTYYFTKDHIGTDAAGILMIMVMVPLFLLAMYRKNGLTLETVLKHYIKEQFFSNKVRVVSTNPVVSQALQTADYARDPNRTKRGRKAFRRSTNGKNKKKRSNKANTKPEDGIITPNDPKSSQMLRDYSAFMHKTDKKKRSPRTGAESVPFERMYENGICYLGDGRYSIMLELSDINYHQLDDADQKDFWSSWCMFLNTLDYECSYQMCFYDRKADVNTLISDLEIKPSETEDEAYTKIISELNDTYKRYLVNGNKGLEKRMFLIINFKVPGFKVKSKANEYAERIRNDLYDKLGISTRLLDGHDRAKVLYHMLNPFNDERMIFDFDLTKNGGISVKEQLINHAFVFGKKADRFMIGSKYCCAAYLKLDANQISDRLLTKFMDLDCEKMISIHIEPVNRDKATKDVKRLVSDLQKMVIDEQRDASNRGYSMTNVSAPLRADLEAAEKTLSGLTQNDEKMFMAVITFVFTADSAGKLERDFSYARAIANEENCELIKLDHQQEDGFFSTLSIGVNRIETKRQLTTTSLGLFLPFKIRELMQFGDSLCFGANKITGNIITADIKTLPNPNTLVLGTPGRGKSFEVKLMIIQVFLKLVDEIIISDPEGEYGPLVRLLKGLVIKLSQSGRNYINPLDINPDCDWEADPISDKSQLMMSIYEQILGPGKGEPNDKSIIDRCIRKIYAKFVESKDRNDLPILEDFYNELDKQPGDRAQFLKEALEVYVHGGLNFFNHRTNVDMNNRVICFDIKELGEQLKSLAMLIVQETVWNRVAVNRANKIYTWYISDEFHLLLKDPQTALYSKEIYKRFRKWGGIPVAITQNVSDLLDSSQAQSIFYNSDCYILLGQASGDADRLSDALKLSNEQYKCILTRNKGEGLLIFGDTVLPFVNRIDEDTYTYKLITTKVTEAEV